MSEFSKKYSVRGIRGATTVDKDSKELIKEATKELLIQMVEKNKVSSDDIAAVFFTTTSDISDEFPAVAAREMGWDTVPLICGHEMDVPHGLEKCIRILILFMMQDSSVPRTNCIHLQQSLQQKLHWIPHLGTYGYMYSNSDIRVPGSKKWL